MKKIEVFRPYHFDKPLFLTTLGLIFLGLIMVFSASGVLAGEKYHQPLYFLIQQGAGVIAGLALIFIILSIKKPFYQTPYFIFGLLFLNFFLLALCFSMPAHAKTNRWIEFLGIRFQPSELAKISLVLFLAFYLERKKDRLQDARTWIAPLSVIILFALLILKEPDFGTAFFIFFICLLLIFIGGIKPRYFVYLGIISLLIFVFYLVKVDYQLDRIFSIIFSDLDPQGINFQVNQSKMAIGSGGLLGVSLGESTQKLYFLPCAHTDFIFAILGEELGLVGTLVTLFLFIIFLWRGLRISFKAPNLFSQLAATGLTLAICLQALLNITVVCGLGPPKGIPLPFFSFGRSSLLCNLFSVGILLHISQRKVTNRFIP